jgi:hypothetical protein
MATKKIGGRKRTGARARKKARGSTVKAGKQETKPNAKKDSKSGPPRDTSKAKIVRLMRKFEKDAKEKPDFRMSVSDYLRLLQVKRDLEDHPANVEVTWVETPDEQPRGE